MTDWLREVLPSYGPLVVSALTFLETVFLTGLVVPAGMSVALATVLALSSELELVWVVVAALAGGSAGDTTGYWIGRKRGRTFWQASLRLKRLKARRKEIDAFISRRPLYSVMLARLIPFVRTVMPVAAGAGGLPYGSFLRHQIPGVMGYVAIYLCIGLLARGSWDATTRLVGTAGALLLAVATLLTTVYWARRKPWRTL